MDKRGPQITHLAYTNDLVIFTSGNEYSIKQVFEQIKKYEKSSRWKLNRDKSSFLTDPKVSPSKINKMREATDFMNHNFPFTYLGCPIYVEKKKLVYFDILVTKIVKRLSGWQGRLLSYGGRMILIKHVMQAIPTYTLATLCPPKGTIKLIERHFPMPSK